MEEGEGPSAGGGEDFGDLYRANLRPLLGMATALIGSRAQAEEVVQEAFATTFDHYGRLEDPTKALRRSVLRGCASRKPDPDDPTRVTERILGRVRALGRGPRDAVALCYSLGLDAPEIDRTLGLEEGTAAMRLHEAGTELRSGLEVGDDLDQTLETAFAETTAGLGHLLARPGDAQRRVYRRRRIRVAIAAVAVVVAAHRPGRGAAAELVGGPLDGRHGRRRHLAVERHDDGPGRHHDDHGRAHDDGGAHDHGRRRGGHLHRGLG